MVTNNPFAGDNNSSDLINDVINDDIGQSTPNYNNYHAIDCDNHGCSLLILIFQ